MTITFYSVIPGRSIFFFVIPGRSIFFFVIPGRSEAEGKGIQKKSVTLLNN